MRALAKKLDNKGRETDDELVDQEQDKKDN
jgi:hypothetical protein